MEQNYQFFLETDVSKYIGEWVAICNGQIVSHSKSPKEVIELAKRACPGKRPLLARIPEKETMIF